MVQTLMSYCRVSFPKIKSFLGSSDFFINSTASELDCSAFDEMHYHKPKLPYSCSAIVPGTTKDVAKHWNPPFQLSKSGKAAVITVGVLMSSFVVLLLVLIGTRWEHRRDRKHRLRRHEALARRGAEEIPLETVGPDELPSYRRTGKPGEVPPPYHATTTEVRGSSSTSTMQSETTSPILETRPAEAEVNGSASVIEEHSNARVIAPEPPGMETRPAEAEVNSPAPGTEVNGDTMVIPSEPITRERNLFGKIWYGRDPERVDVDQGNLWKRIWANGATVPPRPRSGPG
jgi:hypothetical protein